jgi:hypothetical protein
MLIIRAAPSKVVPLPNTLATVLVTPIAPSPITISVNRPIRSTRCVALKLNILHLQDMVIMTIPSKNMTTHQIAKIARLVVPALSLKATDIPMKMPPAAKKESRQSPTGRSKCLNRLRAQNIHTTVYCIPNRKRLTARE